MLKVLAVLSTITILTLSASAFAHGGKPDVMGTVTAIDEHRIEVRPTEGDQVLERQSAGDPQRRQGRHANRASHQRKRRAHDSSSSGTSVGEVSPRGSLQDAAASGRWQLPLFR